MGATIGGGTSIAAPGTIGGTGATVANARSVLDVNDCVDVATALGGACVAVANAP